MSQPTSNGQSIYRGEEQNKIADRHRERSGHGGIRGERSQRESLERGRERRRKPKSEQEQERNRGGMSR